MPNLADLIAARFGVRTEAALNRSGATVGVVAASILRNDPRRLGALIVNLSTAAVYVSPSRGVSATAGVRLAPSGGTFGLDWEDDFDLTGYEWHAVADAAASAVLVIEVLARP